MKHLKKIFSVGCGFAFVAHAVVVDLDGPRIDAIYRAPDLVCHDSEHDHAEVWPGPAKLTTTSTTSGEASIATTTTT